jgi:hypothetical protein
MTPFDFYTFTLVTTMNTSATYQAGLTGQLYSFPLYRIIQFALFVRYYLHSQVAAILKEDLGHSNSQVGSFLLEGFPKRTGICECHLAPSAVGLIWSATERAALYFIEESMHCTNIDHLDTGTLEMLLESYNQRSIHLMGSMNREMSLAVVSVGSVVFNQYPCEFASGIYLMIESVRYHLHWLNRVIDPRNPIILRMLRSEEYADETESHMFVAAVLRNENFKRYAQQLIQEVASVVLASTFLHEGIGNAGYYRLSPNQFALLQCRFIELLKVKFELY